MESNVKPAPKRIPALDLAKALSIICMVFIHVFEATAMASASGNNVFISNIASSGFQKFLAALLEFAGGVVSGGTFIFVMGFLIGFSRSGNSKKYLSQVLKLFLLGIVVNVFQQWVPILFRPDIAGSFRENAPSILATDIYFFDTLIFLFFAFLFLFKEKNRIPICLIAIAVSVALSQWLSPMILGKMTSEASSLTGNVWLDTVIGMFVKVNEWSYFPLFTWLLFPVWGYIIGRVYREHGPSVKDAFILLIVGLAAIVSSHYIMKARGVENVVEFGITGANERYYMLPSFNQLEGFGIVNLAYAVYSLLCIKFKNLVPHVFTLLSTNILEIYIIQWILIGSLTYVLDRVTSIYVNMAIALAILVVSAWLSCVWKKLKARRAAQTAS